MEIKDIEKLLKNSQYEPFIGTFQKIILKDYVYDNIYRIGNKDLGYYLLKLRKNNELNILDSINNLKEIKDIHNTINKGIGIIEKDNYILTISEWLIGKQPIDNDRDSLPIFFSKLAVLNKNNMINGSYTSMYLDGKYFGSTDELVDYEINYHKNYFSENMDIKIMPEILENLKQGLSCIINEDMNCGNLFITDDGEYKIIDTDWIIKGINLYQFQHFDYFGFEEKQWYKISDEAKECYEAYFGAFGLSNDKANEQIRAVELLNVLRENTYLKYSGKENDKEIERRIKIILEHNRYI
jgi:hypothetical protein